MKRIKQKLIVVYDGQCRLCLATTAKIRELHSNAEIVFITIQSIEHGEQSIQIPGIAELNHEALYEKIHVIDEQGRLFVGADGIVRIMRTLRGLGPIATIYHLPGLSRLGDRIYRFIAKHRYDWFGKTDQGCTAESCSLPQHKEEEKIK